MKRIGIFVTALLIVVSGVFAQKLVVISNNSNLNRKGEIVDVKASCKKSYIITTSVVLKNERNEEVPYQLIYNDKKEIQGLIFQADVKAKSIAKYTITEGKPALVASKTFARFVPERKDDFAWENDLAAYRMYGPALANENPSNGVDFWAKNTDMLIVDEFYAGLKEGLSYHKDRGHGLDFYKVAHTLGCGGIAPYTFDSLWIGNHFNSYKVIENGPLRSVFTLTYDSVKVENEFYKETITITTCAGSPLNKATVSYTGKTKKMQLATGIVLHDYNKGLLSQSFTKLFADNSKKVQTGSSGVLCYAEEAISEYNEPSGRNYVGVFNPIATEIIKKNGHAFLLSDYIVGTSFTYYFGGGWSNWKFPTDADWLKAVTEFSVKAGNPLKVNLK